MTLVYGLQKGADRIVLVDCPKYGKNTVASEKFSRWKRVALLAPGSKGYSDKAEGQANLYAKREYHAAAEQASNEVVAAEVFRKRGVAIHGDGKYEPLSYDQLKRIRRDISDYKTAMPVNKFIKNGLRAHLSNCDFAQDLKRSDRKEIVRRIHEEAGQQYVQGLRCKPDHSKRDPSIVLPNLADKVILEFLVEKRRFHSGQIIEKSENKSSAEIRPGSPVAGKSKNNQGIVLPRRLAQLEARRNLLVALQKIEPTFDDKVTIDERSEVVLFLLALQGRVEGRRTINVDKAMAALFFHITDHEYQSLERALSEYARTRA